MIQERESGKALIVDDEPHILRAVRNALASDFRDVLEAVGSSRVDLQACKLEYSIVSPK